MSPEALVFGLVWSNSMQSLMALAIGFAVAGALTNGYQAVTMRPPSFHLLNEDERSKVLTAVPLLLFAAPFIIVRNVVRAARAGSGSFGFAMMAGLVAGFWSLMSGTVVVMAFRALGRLAA